MQTSTCVLVCDSYRFYCEGADFARNDNRFRSVYNVIPTEVRINSERSGEIPHVRSFVIRRLPFEDYRYRTVVMLFDFHIRAENAEFDRLYAVCNKDIAESEVKLVCAGR